ARIESFRKQKTEVVAVHRKLLKDMESLQQSIEVECGHPYDKHVATLNEEAETKLDVISVEANDLETELELLRLDHALPSRNAFNKSVQLIDDDDDVRKRYRQCDCAGCRAGRRSSAIAAAAVAGTAYTVRLRRHLGFNEEGKSSLQLEREKLREDVLRDSPYGRTGSYRGFGAGALKPARHLNSNNKNVTAAAVAAQPVKTEKKAKKPALGR
ncbi:hypothetical protein B0A55_05268, partial [Friedmanniomyces simplex]